MPSTCQGTASPARRDWHARAITSHGRMRMDHEVFRLPPHNSAQAPSDGPEGMPLSISPPVSLNRLRHPMGRGVQLMSTVG